MMQRTALIIAGMVLSGSGLLAVEQTAASQYRIANRFHPGGDGGWDYIAVEEATARLFVSHGTLVQVLDEKTGALLGTIPDTKGVHDDCRYSHPSHFHADGRFRTRVEAHARDSPAAAGDQARHVRGPGCGAGELK